MEYRVDRYGDTTITLRQVKISNIDSWDKLCFKDLLLTKEEQAELNQVGQERTTSEIWSQ